MEEFYFECDCGGKAIHKVYLLTDDTEEGIDVSELSQSVFQCQKCGKKYYTGDWEDFCTAEEDL
ncbi:MAG: hypothetical protein J6K45_06455 [Clostridia bacterium]|nr:hypothetical protein [Clostridia bacterium]